MKRHGGILGFDRRIRIVRSGSGTQLRNRSHPEQISWIEAASRVHAESSAWAFFVQKIVCMPLALSPAVRAAMMEGRWRNAALPLDSLRGSALRLASAAARYECAMMARGA